MKQIKIVVLSFLILHFREIFLVLGIAEVLEHSRSILSMMMVKSKNAYGRSSLQKIKTCFWGVLVTL